MDQGPYDDAFQREMLDYIRRHFAGLLGEHVALLDEPDGLDQLAALVRTGRIGGVI